MKQATRRNRAELKRIQNERWYRLQQARRAPRWAVDLLWALIFAATLAGGYTLVTEVENNRYGTGETT